MKTIGINTIHNCQNNYGGALQCYALYKYIKDIGYPVEVIDLHRPNKDADFIDSIRYRNMRSHISLWGLTKGWIKEILGIRRLHNPNFKANWNPIAGEKFNEFNSRIKMSSPYNYIPDLYKNPPLYDIYITGSDQLWNPDQPYCLEPYFLTFVKNIKALKISYGTSIGLSEINKKEEKKFRKWLSSYDSISVREIQAVKILESVTNHKVTRVPDPTFLVNPEDWIEMSVSPNIKEDYILLFSAYHDNSVIKTGNQISKELNCKVKVIDQNYNYSEYENIEVIADAGPLEFIGLIYNAKLVITDSFHCTVFSIITGVNNFYTYISPNNNRGSRIIDLLNTFNLSNHLIHSMDELNVSKLLNTKIDRSYIYNVIKQEQKIGRDFLAKSLSIEK